MMNDAIWAFFGLFWPFWLFLGVGPGHDLYFGSKVPKIVIFHVFRVRTAKSSKTTFFGNVDNITKT